MISVAYHLLAEEFKTLERSHGLCACLYVSEDDVRLPTHLLRLQGNYIQDRTIRGKQSVE